MKLTHPYTPSDSPWLRGNLHTHTTNSDGKLSPEDVVDHYARHGYDYLAISDHDVFTEPLEHDQVLGIPAVEVSAGGPHLLSVGGPQVYDTTQPRGAIVSQIMADGNLCVLNHPNWQTAYAHWDHAAMEAVGPYHGIEIFNSVIDFLDGEAHALDRWDRLLSKGLKVWGYSHDDFHNTPHGPRGWNVVCAERTVENIIAALKEGRFYASTGVSFERIAVEGETFQVVAPDADEIRFVSRFGKVLSMVDGADGSYTINGSEQYVRAEAYGRGKTAAWTQPVFVTP